MSKELEALKDIDFKCSSMMPKLYKYQMIDGKIDIIKQALLKAQELEKVLKIIFEKRVDMWHLVDLLDQTYEMYVAFCKSEKYADDYILTKDEFNSIKGMLKND